MPSADVEHRRMVTSLSAEVTWDAPGSNKGDPDASVIDCEPLLAKTRSGTARMLTNRSSRPAIETLYPYNDSAHGAATNQQQGKGGRTRTTQFSPFAATTSTIANGSQALRRINRKALDDDPTPSSSSSSLLDLEASIRRPGKLSGSPTSARAAARRGVKAVRQKSNWQVARQYEEGLQIEDQEATQLESDSSNSSIWDEKWQLALLVLLYMMQGIPMGLALGAMPFMLQNRLSYSQIGIFSLAAYPYSFKLLWSPVVDSLYSVRMGRRKTWIIPIQLCTAGLLFFGAGHVAALYEAADVQSLTALFFVIVFLAATQDIAVDGWALTLLPPQHVSWASTSQTIGGSTGFFTSFTVFLALQDVSFCNTYLRSWSWAQRWLGTDPTSTQPMVTLPGYLRFWGGCFAIVTILLWLFKTERPTEEELNKEATSRKLAALGRSKLQALVQELKSAYANLWGVARLRAIWGLVALLLTYRLGVLVVEGAASLKLIDKGVPKETLAALVLVQFPIELASAVFAGRWAAAASPAPPFLASYFMRLLVNAGFAAVVGLYPSAADGTGEGGGTDYLFAVYIGLSLLGSAVSALAFTSLGSLFNSISDPEMGGAYLTLLNTIANMGVILPKAPFFYLMDALTQVQCQPPITAESAMHPRDLDGLSCPMKASDLGSSSACTEAGGVCVMVQDGFYLVSWTCLSIGLALGLVYLRYLPVLMRLPISAWRADTANKLKQQHSK